jgi:hypothetical protein
VSALLARPPLIVVPKVEHGLAEMLHNIAAVEINVFDQCATIFAVENNVFVLSRRTTTLDYYSQRVRRSHGSVRNIWRDKERLPFPHEMIDNPVAFADTHFDVAFELIKIFFRIDQMKIVPRVRAFDHHHEKVAPVIKIPVTYWRLEFLPVLFDPVF